jgi:hypothetical protein
LHLQAEGKAVNGEYNITGTITSSVLLLRLFLKEGSAAPFIVDDTTAKIKQLSLLT